MPVPTAYAAATDLIDRYDVRDLGMLVMDDGTVAAAADLPTNDKIEAALAGAAGEVEAALLHGERYAVSDLTGLTGNSLAYLIDLVCTVAYWRLWKRRAWDADKPERITAKENAGEELERLRRGEHVFNVAANLDASTPSITGPTRVELNDLNLIRDQASRFYPIRRLPNGR